MSPTDVAETTAPILHLRGPILLGAEEEQGGAWVVGGRIHHEKPELPAGAEVREIDGFVLPGLADLHCHLGIADGGGGTTLAEAREQALVDRDSGVLLIRDAGSIIDNSPLQQQDDLPRLIRCGRHLARTRRYLIGYADELEPEDLPAAVTREAGRGDGWVKLVGDWIDRGVGDLTPCWEAQDFVAAADAAHAAGARRRTTGVRPNPARPFGVEVLVPAGPSPDTAPGRTPGARGGGTPSYWVYGHDRTPCLRCRGPVRQEDYGSPEDDARRLWWCPHCQR